MASGSASCDLRAKLEAAVRAAYPVTVAAIEEGVSNVLGPAQSAWPVKTGTSKAAFESAVTLTSATTVDGVIRNDARNKLGRPYAFYIRPHGTKYRSGAGLDNRTVWQTLVATPMTKEARKVANAAASELVHVIKVARNG